MSLWRLSCHSSIGFASAGVSRPSELRLLVRACARLEEEREREQEHAHGGEDGEEHA